MWIMVSGTDQSGELSVLGGNSRSKVDCITFGSYLDNVATVAHLKY